LPESFSDLKHLERLYISVNPLCLLPDSIGKLEHLRYLSAYTIQLNALPDFIANLTQLIELVVFHNRLTVLPDWICNLTQLKRLDCYGTQLSVLPECICNLTQLETLDVGSNQLSVLPESIGNLTKLKRLNVCSNQLSALPESLLSLEQLKELYLHENTKLGIPQEVLGPTWSIVSKKKVSPSPPRTILDYYLRTMSGAQRPLNEVKLLLVGRGGAGKTSIVRRLREDKFSRSQKETRGITINTWNLNCEDEEVRVNVWDFAGQIITHSTHHFFLTQRSVYILVLTGREDSQRADAEYWLRLIKAFGTDGNTGETSPVVVALNKWGTHQFRVDRR